MFASGIQADLKTSLKKKGNITKRKQATRNQRKKWKKKIIILLTHLPTLRPTLCYLKTHTHTQAYMGSFNALEK